MAKSLVSCFFLTHGVEEKSNKIFDSVSEKAYIRIAIPVQLNAKKRFKVQTYLLRSIKLDKTTCKSQFTVYTTSTLVNQ